MLRAALSFFVFGIIAMVLGFYNVAGVSIEVGKALLGVFTVLALLAIGASIITGRKARIT